MSELDQHIWPLTAQIDGNGQLQIGGCTTTALAAAYGTPLYVFDEVTIRAAARAYRDALAHAYPAASSVHYASKALLNSALAQLIASEGLGLDVVSGGELFVALRAGFPAERIHLHGNAKPRVELEQALSAGIGTIVVDTLDELALLASLTATRAAPQSIMLRLAPAIATDTHAHIQTGHAASKFGLPLDALDAAAELVRAAPGLHLHGLHAHLGSQLFDAAVFARAIGVLLESAAQLRQRHGIIIDALSPGGGLGVPYLAEQPLPDVEQYAATLANAVRNGCTRHDLPLPRLIIEPGRSIVARAGVALYQILASKALPAEDHATRYVHIDGGMGDNIRPALYSARYTSLLANRASATPDEIVHVAGRYCESGDVLLRDCALPHPTVGDLLAVAAAGAYTLSMASNYNLTLRPAVLLVADGQARVMQRRETYEDLVQRDQMEELLIEK